jgi:hypothetical protein
LEYELHPSETFDVYPFVNALDDVFRPSDTTWTPDLCVDLAAEFIYVSPATHSEERPSLIFVKHGDEDDVAFRGVMLVHKNDRIIEWDRQIRHICHVSYSLSFQLLDLFSSTHCRWVDPEKTFEQMQLGTGSILVVYDGPEVKESRKSVSPLVWKRYGPHISHEWTDLAKRNPLVHALYQQATLGHHTEVIITLASMTDNSFHVNAHKAVLVTVPYFRTMFESGLKESQFSPVITLEAPGWVEKPCLEAFILYLYMRQSWVLEKLTVEILTNMIRLADYYSFDDLLNAILRILEAKFYQLTDVNVIEILKVLDSLESERKSEHISFLAGYVVCNFSRIMQNAGFINLFGTDVYRSIVVAVDKHCLDAESADRYT